MDTFAEVCEMTGWEVFAWVLMDNHYHFVFRTPKANLVDGMTWFQNTYTRRLNCRHKLWGHLFGGRYRSILIENEDLGGAVWRDYLRTVIDYVHLNPGRASLIDGVGKKAADYQWSSLATAYDWPPSKRPPWVAVTEVLDLFQKKDTKKGRQAFLTRLDRWISEGKGIPEIDGVKVEERVARGWIWGAEDFKESVLQLYEKQLKARKTTLRDAGRTYQSSPLAKDHALMQAEEILKRARKHFRLSAEELVQPLRGDLTRAAIADRIFRETTVSQKWIAEMLGMKSVANVCQQIRRFRRTDDGELSSSIKRWTKIKIF